MFSANNQLLLKNNKNKKAEIKEKETDWENMGHQPLISAEWFQMLQGH